MKKIYNAPEASFLCFRPMEDLAIQFGNLVNVGTFEPAQGEAAKTSVGDIKISI